MCAPFLTEDFQEEARKREEARAAAEESKRLLAEMQSLVATLSPRDEQRKKQAEADREAELMRLQVPSYSII